MNSSTEQLRDELRGILGVAVPKSGYRQIFTELDRSGKLDFKTLTKVVIILLEHLEKIENDKALQPAI